jgi:hypothetical protein
MAIQSNFPSIRPSLLLDFANSKRLDPRVTFTRASTATYYDGVTVSKAEENLLLQSQAFDTGANWAVTNAAVTANTTTAPDGTSTADTLTASAGSGTPRLAQSVTLTQTNTFSIFVKAGTHTYVQLRYVGDGTSYVNFDVTAGAGAVGTSAGTATGSIVSVGNDWYRCIAVNTSTAVTQCVVNMVTSSSAVRNETWTPVGTETVFVWGAQAELRSAVTAYTATTTQAITNYVPRLLTAAAGVARFDHTPTTGASLGLLVEESRQNLVTYSDDFANAAWTKTRASVESNVAIAPDGTLTGDKLIASTDASTTHFIQNGATTTAVAHGFSVYVKAAGYNFVYLLNATASLGAYFDLANVAVGTVSAGASGTIVDVGNGWRRCTLIATATAASNGFRIHPAASTSSASLTGDGYAGLFIWGAQLETGAFSTSYIPTVASAVTRSADSASMTGTNFSSWYNTAEGTVYAEAASQSATVANIVFSIDDGTLNNRISMNVIGGSNIAGRFTVGTSGTVQADIQQSGTIVANQFYRQAGAYKVNNFALAKDGATIGTDVVGTVPVVTRMTIGNRLLGTGTNEQTLNGTIRKLAFYPIRVSDANLVAISG